MKRALDQGLDGKQTIISNETNVMIRKLRKRGFTLIELMIVVAIIGILAAIAIPNFIKFQARSKQGEAKANLKSLFTAQRSYFQEKDKYVTTIGDIGFSPERGNRYSYDNGSTAAAATWVSRATVTATSVPATDAAITVDIFKFVGASTNPTFVPPTAYAWAACCGPNPAATAGVTNTGTAWNFLGWATGNIDSDSVYDSWYISSKDGAPTGSCGNTDTAAPAGGPFNSNNDVTC